MQNPIHTMWCKPADIDNNKIIGSSNFTRRMARLDFNKQAVDYFKDIFKAKYLMIDTCDCRNDMYLLKNKEGEVTYICKSISSEKTIQQLFSKDQYQIKNVFELTEEYWNDCLVKFVKLIESQYCEENIIINQFVFAEQYVDLDGTIKDFKYIDLYRKRGKLCFKIEEKLKRLMPKAKVITAFEKPLGNANHKIGLAPMHYTDECYYVQNEKLENLFFNI